MIPITRLETRFVCYGCGWEGHDHELLAGPGSPTCPDCGGLNFVAER